MKKKDISTKNIVLFYPKLGWMDVFILDLPLSVLYVAYDCKKNQINVRIVDQRVHGSSWPKALEEAIDADTLLVGFSVMSGTPILNALNASRFCKEKYPDIPIVWGGIHVTINPKSVLDSPLVDFIISGLGSHSLYLLVRFLFLSDCQLAEIPGLGWCKGDEQYFNPQSNAPFYSPLDDLDINSLDMTKYTRFNYNENVYSLFTSFGCPHKCRFCFAPIFWKNTQGRHWIPYDAEDVVAHIVKVVKNYNIGYVSILDENFFIDLKRVEKIFSGICEQGVSVRWGIRGARIDDMDRMDDAFLQLMFDMGVEQIMIGAESGSQKMLNLMKKGIRVEQTIRVNQKLARFSKIKPSYNFLSGIPGETVDDLFLSADLAIKLIDENPNASFTGMNQFIPFPGSALYDECVKGGHQEPCDLEEWALIDTHYNNIKTPWNSLEVKNMLHALQATLMFVDKKAERELGGGGQRGSMLKLLYSVIFFGTKLYRPIARYRLRNRFFKFPIDYQLIKLAVRIMSHIT